MEYTGSWHMGCKVLQVQLDLEAQCIIPLLDSAFFCGGFVPRQALPLLIARWMFKTLDYYLSGVLTKLGFTLALM